MDGFTLDHVKSYLILSHHRMPFALTLPLLVLHFGYRPTISFPPLLKKKLIFRFFTTLLVVSCC